MINYKNYDPQVKLIAYTTPSKELIDRNIRNAEELIAYIARISNPKNKFNNETSERLINYLIDHKHWSPFEHFYITLEVHSARDIVRQILRHRSFTFQEFSQRYADPTEMEFVIREARLQDKKNRQNSIDFDDESIKDEWNLRQLEVLEVAHKNYVWALKNGIAKECARVILPEGNTPSVVEITGNIRSWIHYLDIRSKEAGTQKEHYEIAHICAEIIKEHFPKLKNRKDKNVNR